MTSYRKKLCHSVVLHPEFMLRDLRTDSLVEAFLDRCEFERPRHLQLAGRLWSICEKTPSGNELMEVFQGELENGTAESLALFGEIFIENSGDEDVLKPGSIEEYFKVLGDKSVIFCSLSRSKRLLKEYSRSGDERFVLLATLSYKRALFRGSLTGLVLYVVFRKSVERNEGLGSILDGFFTWVLNALFSIFSGIVSMGIGYKNRWWRYTEIYHWMPRKVESIDGILISKNVEW